MKVLPHRVGKSHHLNSTLGILGLVEDLLCRYFYTARTDSNDQQRQSERGHSFIVIDHHYLAVKRRLSVAPWPLL